MFVIVKYVLVLVMLSSSLLFSVEYCDLKKGFNFIFCVVSTAIRYMMNYQQS